jgi:Bacterial alpha-L-rhamnosidase 6 hairpin glycosidase domain
VNPRRAVMIRTATTAWALVAPIGLAPEARAQALDYEVTATMVRQGRFAAHALGRDTIVSSYPRAAREVHFKFALNGRDNEFPPGIEHTINLRPRDGTIVTPVYAFGMEPRPLLPRPEDATEGEDGTARVTIRLDLRAVQRAIAEQGWYKPPQGDTIRRLRRVTVIGDTDPLVWDIGAVGEGAAQDLSDANEDGIWEATLTFRTDYLRPLDRQGRAIWVRSRDLSAFPRLTSPQSLLDATYRLSLEELTQLVREDGALSAGAKWPGVWTRDVALSSLLGLAFVEPDAVRTSLMRKVDATGRIIQDTGTGGSWPVSTDRMTWALAAWEVYAVTGDRDWLRTAYDVIARSAEADEHVALDRATGLFRGESSFLDWREQSYPRWMQPADIYQSQALGTNAVHHGAYRVLAQMANDLGEPSARAALWRARADTLRSAMAERLWIPALGRHAQFIYGRTAMSRSARFEALGEALALLTGVTPQAQWTTVIQQGPLMSAGTPTFWPFIAGVPFYHNGTVWPFVTAYWAWAAADAGDANVVAHAIMTMTRATALFLTNKENLVAETGHFDGTALNSDRQLWSVAGSLAVQYRLLFGLRLEHDRLRFQPVVPGLYAGDRELRGLRYREATLTVRVRGSGARVRSATLDGVPLERAEVPATLRGEHVVELVMDGRTRRRSTVRPVGAQFAPATPSARVADAAMDGMLDWEAVPGAVRYVVHRNAVPVDTVAERGFPIVRTGMLDEFQVEALDSRGVASFLSEPVRVVTVDGEREIIPTGGPVRLERGSAPVTLRVQVPEAGRYALDALYSNGSGPINTEDKAAVRTLAVDGRDLGVLVMAQRGAGNWSERGWSNALVVSLPAGEQAITVRWDARDENMNGRVSTADLHGLRLTRLPDPD